MWPHRGGVPLESVRGQGLWCGSCRGTAPQVHRERWCRAGLRIVLLLRRSFRETGTVRNETLANLSALPPEAIAAVKAVLAGECLGRPVASMCDQRRCPPMVTLLRRR